MANNFTLAIEHTWDGRSADPEERVSIFLSWVEGGLQLRVDAPFHGDPPPHGPVGSTEELWNYEVVELFVAGPATAEGAVAYTEIELSPHGHHLVLRFEGVRRAVERRLPLSFTASIAGGRWAGGAELPASYLPEGPLRANAYAIHGEGEERRYLAMTPVPGAQPDFHQPETFQPLDTLR